ncbi:MAG: hypothetical protein FWG72_09115 [Oscillospiraceae bacterium]|nr:hypothetical protein [Oscillospiraceae bacterium]
MTLRQYKNASKGMKIFTIASTAVILAAVAGLLALSFRDPSVTVEDRQIRISGMYGQTIGFDEVKSITLIEKTMNELGPGRRINGVGGIGQTLRGCFNSDGLGTAALFVKSRTAPTIWIECEGRPDVYISYGDSQKTREVYEGLLSSVR